MPFVLLPDGGRNGFEDTQKLTAFPGLEGEVLNLRDLEQGVDQMNRLPSNKAKTELVPGDEPGTSNVVVVNEPGPRARWSFGQSNGGVASTGVVQGTSTFEMDNMLQLNDYWSITASSVLGNQLNRRNSRSISTFFSIPYGYWTWTTSADLSSYKVNIPGAGIAADSELTGNSLNFGFGLSRVMHRDQDSKSLLSAPCAPAVRRPTSMMWSCAPLHAG